jgi:hypothetical protein
VIVGFVGGGLLGLLLLTLGYAVRAADFSPVAFRACSLNTGPQGRMHLVCKEVLQLGSWVVFVWKELKKFARSEIIYVELGVLRVLLEDA